MAELRMEARRRIADRPSLVVLLVLLHAAILQQIVLPDLLPGMASAWGWRMFSGPSLSTAQALFPRLGFPSLLAAMCLAGLWYSRGWAWLLALYLDITGIIARLSTLWFQRSPWPSESLDMKLLLLISLEWLSLIVLFQAEVREEYLSGFLKPIDTNIHNSAKKGLAALKHSANQLQPAAKVGDTIIIGLVALTQLLASFLGLLSLPFIFNYGGAAANPNLFPGLIMFLCAGILSAFYLATKATPARVISLVWHSVIVSSIASNNLILTSKGTWRTPFERGVGLWAAFVSFAAFYLSAYLAARIFSWFLREKWPLLTSSAE